MYDEKITFKKLVAMAEDIFRGNAVESPMTYYMNGIPDELANSLPQVYSPHHPMYDDVRQWWKLNPNTNIQLLSIEERKMLGRYKKKRKERN